jgi:hypothetical protein
MSCCHYDEGYADGRAEAEKESRPSIGITTEALCAHYAYEQECGPAENLPEVTKAHQQWTYTGGDPREVAA